VLAYHSLMPKCTPWFVSNLQPHHCGIASASLYPFHSNSAFVLTKSIQYPAWCWFTPSTIILISLVPSYIHPIRSIQEKVTSDHIDDCFSLEVLAPIEGVSLSIGTWDSSSPPRVSDKVIRPRGLSDEHNMTTLYNVLYHPRRKEKLHGRLWRSSSRLFRHSLISTTNAPFSCPFPSLS
jgi:hypothetical protein